MISITRPEVPDYLRSGDFYRSLSDDEDQDQHISIPSTTLKPDTTVKNNTDLHHFLTSLRFWGVMSIQDEVIKYCLSDLEFPCHDILQEFARDFPYLSVVMTVLSANKDEKVMMAVESGILKIVWSLPKYLMVIVDCCSAAARAGNLEILQCLHERGGELNTSVLHAALEGGDKSLACVQYLRAQGVKWPPSTLVTALKAGSKECFHYALQDGCKWDKLEDSCVLCEDNYVDALKFAIQNGCPVSDYLAPKAALNGAIKCLQALHEVDCPWDEDACNTAAQAGHLDCLMYLHENRCPWNEFTIYWAAYGNHIDCLQYALQQGCPVHRNSCTIAATGGHLRVLTCFYDHGYPWDKYTCTDTAANGHLDCLQYAHEHGALWDESTFRRTLERRQLECLKYLLANGCPIDMKECRELIAQGKCSQQAVDMVGTFCNASLIEKSAKHCALEDDSVL